MLKSIIRTLLQKFIDDIDSDNCNITMEQQSKIISVLSNIANPDQRMSKIQACDYLGVSRATFDNYVRDTGTANTNQIIAKLDAMQNQALLDKIDALREKNSQQAVVINNAQQTAAFGQMIGQATSPIVAAVNALQSDVNGIKCKLPETVTLPYSCATAVPTQAVFNGYALGTYAGWNGCGCNNSLWG